MALDENLGDDGLGDFPLGGLSLTYSIEESIRRLLIDDIDTPIYRRRKQGCDYPCITYEVTATDYDKYLASKCDRTTATIEYTVWSREYDDLWAISKDIRGVIDMFSGSAKSRTILSILHQGENDIIHQPEDGSEKVIYGRVIEFEIQYLES